MKKPKTIVRGDGEAPSTAAYRNARFTLATLCSYCRPHRGDNADNRRPRGARQPRKRWSRA